MDIQTILFETALGIKEPLYIKHINFDESVGELHIHVDFRRGSKLLCPSCSNKLCCVHDTTDKAWRHLNCFQYKCFIHFRNPKLICEDCGVRQYIPSWARPHSGFTSLFEGFVLTLATEMPVSKIAALVGEHDTRIWRIIHYHVSKSYAGKDLSNLTNVGVDETSSRKGHKYISVFVDMNKHEVVYATPGKDESTIARFADELTKHNTSTERIANVSMDMSPAFIKGATKCFKNAEITFDKFHVVKQLNEAIDEIRRNETALNPCLKGTRYLWLKNPDNLSPRQRDNLKSLSKENRRLAKAYQMKLTLQDIYRKIIDPTVANIALKKWLSWAVRSRLDPIKKFAHMVKSHYLGILQYFVSRLTAGISEGTNSRIQEIKRRSKGFRNIDYFITMIYLVASNLTLPSLP